MSKGTVTFFDVGKGSDFIPPTLGQIRRRAGQREDV
jgi:hypothetical protein